MRTEYKKIIRINGKKLKRVIIDQHYKENHPEVDDELILKLVLLLDKGIYSIESTSGDFEYFSVEPVYLDDKPYRLVLVLCICDDYLGVVNAFRVRRKKR